MTKDDVRDRLTMGNANADADGNVDGDRDGIPRIRMMPLIRIDIVETYICSACPTRSVGYHEGSQHAMIRETDRRVVWYW